MKKLIALATIVTLLCTGVVYGETNNKKLDASSSPSVTDSNLPIYVEGTKLEGTGYGTTETFMVPLRDVNDALGYKTSWQEDKTLRTTTEKSYVDMKIGENYYVGELNDSKEKVEYTLDSAPVLKNGTTYVPVPLYMAILGNPNKVEITISGIYINKIPEKKDEVKQDVPEKVRTEEVNKESKNETIKYNNIDELSEAMDFSILKLYTPEGYSTTSYTMTNNIGEIISKKSDETIVYRVTRGNKDMSENKINYPQRSYVYMDNLEINIKGEYNQIKIATWYDGEASYSLTFSEGIKRPDFKNMFVYNEDAATNKTRYYQTKKELDVAFGDKIDTPSIPSGYTVSYYAYINGIAEILYENDDNDKILFRITSNMEVDMTNGYNNHPNSKRDSVNSMVVYSNGYYENSKDETYIATWKDEEFSYSIFANDPLSSSQIIEMVISS
ncbi:MAG: copper amine oxidase N-terminal domain-containing protein [Lachnospirales bacterium]